MRRAGKHTSAGSAHAAAAAAALFRGDDGGYHTAARDPCRMAVAKVSQPQSRVGERSAEGCVATLLREIEDPLSIEDLPPAVGSSDYDAQASAMAPDSAIVRAATAAAERRRRWRSSSSSSSSREGSGERARARTQKPKRQHARVRRAVAAPSCARSSSSSMRFLEERQRATDDLAARWRRRSPAGPWAIAAAASSAAGWRRKPRLCVHPPWSGRHDVDRQPRGCT